MVAQALLDIESKEAKAAYQAVLSDVRAGNYDEALKGFDRLETEVKRQPEPYAANGIAPSRIRDDRAYVNTLAQIPVR